MLRGPISIKKIMSLVFESFGIWILFEPRDLWLGVYWKVDCTHIHIYLTIIPTLPILFTWVRKR